MKILTGSHKGFSLVEVLVAVGIAGVLGVSLMRMTTQSMKVQKTVRTSGEIQDISSVIKGLLVNVKTCTKTFEGMDAVDGIADSNSFGVQVYDKNSDSYVSNFLVGSKHGIGKGSKILSYRLKENVNGLEVSKGFTQLFVTFERTGTYTKRPVRIIPMWVKVSGTSIQSCQALSMETSIWERSLNDRSNIFYDSVASPTGTPATGVVSIGVSPDNYVNNDIRLQVHKRAGKSYLGISSSSEGAGPSDETGLQICSNLNLSSGLCQSKLWKFYSSTDGNLHIANKDNEDWISFFDGTIEIPGKKIYAISESDDKVYTSIDENGISITNTGNTTSTGFTDGATSPATGMILNINGLSLGKEFTLASPGDYVTLQTDGLVVSKSGFVVPSMDLSELDGAIFGADKIAIGANNKYTVMTNGGVAVSEEGAFTPNDISSGSVSGSIHNATMFAVGSGVTPDGTGTYSILTKDGVAVTNSGFLSPSAISNGKGSLMNYMGFGVGSISGGVNQGYAFLGTLGLIVVKPGGPLVLAGSSIPAGTEGATIDGEKIAVGVVGDHGVSLLGEGKVSIVKAGTEQLHITPQKIEANILEIDALGTLSLKSAGALTFTSNNLSFNVSSSFVNFNSSTLSAGKFTTPSDKRLKRNIEPLNEDRVIEDILKLRPVSYFYRKNKNGSRRIGFIAQEVQTVYPSFIEGNEKTGYLSIDHMSFISPIIKAVQFLIKKVTEPSDYILAIERELKLQREIIKNLNKRVKEMDGK